MLRKFLLTIFIGIVIGTGAKAGWFGPDDFKVKQSDTRFSEDHNPTFIGQNNRISSKSIAGGVHIDASGVYVDPMVTKNERTGHIVFLGLEIENRTSEDTQFGDVNSLGVPQNISFLLNGSTSIILQIDAGSVNSSSVTTYNTVGRYASVDVNEKGVAALTAQQYEEIISANSVAVKIAGSKRSVVYEASEVSASFMKNLKSFYDKYAR